METNITKTQSMNFDGISISRVKFVWGCIFENMFPPKGWPKNLQQI